MSAFRSIELAIELAMRQRDALARKHAQAVRSVDFAKAQLAQLNSYAQEIDGRWGSAQAATLTGEMLHHHYQFRERLQQAVNLQLGAISTVQTQREIAHRALLNAEYKLAGLRQVLVQRQAGVALLQQRREQREMDEFAAQKHARQAVASMQGECS